MLQKKTLDRQKSFDLTTFLFLMTIRIITYHIFIVDLHRLQ